MRHLENLATIRDQRKGDLVSVPLRHFCDSRSDTHPRTVGSQDFYSDPTDTDERTATRHALRGGDSLLLLLPQKALSLVCVRSK